MIARTTIFALTIAAVQGAAPAFAAGPDFTRFLSSASGAAGLAAAMATLGACDTVPEWSLYYDEEIGADNPNHLYVGCQYDPDWEEGDELYDKGVVAKFQEFEGVMYLESLTQLP